MEAKPSRFKSLVRAAKIGIASLFLGTAGFIGINFFGKPDQGAPIVCPLTSAFNKSASGNSANGEIRVFSANVQGLPHKLEKLERGNNPYPANRFDCLAQIIAQHDVALLQEDFTQMAALRNAGLSNIWSPEAARSYMQTNSGVTMMARGVFQRIKSGAYDHCNGSAAAAFAYEFMNAAGIKIKRINAKADCLANKSYKVAQLEGVTYVTSHLDAGRTRADVAARGLQLAQLSRAVPKTGAVIVGMDANVKNGNATDEANLAKFMRDNSLTMALRDETDVILTRGVDVLSAARIDLTNLSDHAGLSVSFKIKPRGL